MNAMTQTPEKLTRFAPCPRRQRGTILFVSLIILLLLTILGVTAMSNVTMEERMAGNLRDGALATQSAEAALRSAEAWLTAVVAEPGKCSTIGTACATAWDEGILPDLSFLDDTWWTTNGRLYVNNGGGNELTGGDTVSGRYVAANPEFIIEFQKYVPDSLVVGHKNSVDGKQFFLVTARAHGGSISAESVLQTSFTKRF
jgi:type IV pilus assembly protein PilX